MNTKKMKRLKQRVVNAKSELPLVSYREMAEVMGISEANIYKTYLRAINNERCAALLEAIDQVRAARGE